MADRNKRLEAGIAALRTGASQGTALTATTQTTELVDGALVHFKSGFLLVTIGTLVGTGTYTIDLEGRALSGDAYSTLATFTPVAVGTYAIPVHHFKGRLRLNVTIGGTSPSITFAATAIATARYTQPDSGAVITA